METQCPRICYFGIYRPSAPRDKVYLEGLKKRGFQIIECVDNSPGLLKFFRSAEKLYALRNQYDILWVGYLSPMMVPLAKLISRKKIVYNALDSWYDRSILDRGMYSKFSPKAWVIWLCDFLAFHLSGVVLVESEQQKKFIGKKFFVNSRKLCVVFTGVDEEVFHPDSSVTKAEDFTVVFRGLFLPATGVEYVLGAARLLKNENIKFTIVGWGQPMQAKIERAIADEKLTNVTLITWFLSPEELRKTIASSHVMLGQFGNHPRLNRTIQNKNFEALAMGEPFITRDSLSNRELLTDGESAVFVPSADPRAIAEKIMMLKNTPSVRIALSLSARHKFETTCRGEVLVAKFQKILATL